MATPLAPIPAEKDKRRVRKRKKVIKTIDGVILRTEIISVYETEEERD